LITNLIYFHIKVLGGKNDKENLFIKIDRFGYITSLNLLTDWNYNNVPDISTKEIKEYYDRYFPEKYNLILIQEL
jgi:hypothetical protein